jgi:HEPN domain-containing protein
VCFHCQQSAEKYLKGLMEEAGLAVPKTHYLDKLLKPLITAHPELQRLRRGLLFLTVFAVETRYPGRNASKRQAVAAVRWAGRVRSRARALLGIRKGSGS